MPAADSYKEQLLWAATLPCKLNKSEQVMDKIKIQKRIKQQVFDKPPLSKWYIKQTPFMMQSSTILFTL